MNNFQFSSQIEKIAQIGSYRTDLTRGTWTGSENFLNLFGLSPKAKFTINEFKALVHPEDLSDVMSYFGKCLDEKMDFDYEYRCIKKTGELIYVKSRSKVYYANDGTPLYILGIKQDITAQKVQEMEINAYNQKLNQRKDEALALVAHDLKTPIAQVKGVSNLLKYEIKENELLEVLDHACADSLSMIEQLMEDIKSKDINYSLEIANVNEIAKTAINRFYYTAKAKNIQLDYYFTTNAFALVDKAKMSHVIDNLISNAIKFSTAGSLVTVKTSRQNNRIFIDVIDEGIGIPKQIMPLLFKINAKEKQRVGTAGEATSGVGLALIKEIVEKHNGSILVKSAEGKGSTFTVCLPVE